MTSFFKGRTGAIGLDISGRWIKAAQAAANAQGNLRVSAAARIKKSESAQRSPGVHVTSEDADLIAGAIDRSGFKGHTVVLGAPRDLLMCDVLELPPRASGAPIEQLARIEVARAHRCEPTSFELGMWDLPRLGRAARTSPQADQNAPTQVFTVALAHDRAESIVAHFAGVGLEVVAIDAPALAAARTCHRLPRPQDAAEGPQFSAILDIGYNGAQLVVLHTGTVVYERSISESALSRLFAAVKARMGLDEDAAMLVLSAASADQDQSPASALRIEARACLTEFLEQLVPEVQRSMSYVAHKFSASGPPVSHLTVTGDGAELGGVCDRLSLALDAPAVPARIASVIPHAPGLTGIDTLATAIGLSEYTLLQPARAAA